jgi:hypothetical protein
MIVPREMPVLLVVEIDRILRMVEGVRVGSAAGAPLISTTRTLGRRSLLSQAVRSRSAKRQNYLLSCDASRFRMRSVCQKLGNYFPGR